MKNKAILAGVCVIALLGACNIAPPPTGEATIDFSLDAARQLGYEVTQVHCTLRHQASGKVVERDLEIQEDTASGVIAGLRIGTWSLLVELFEGEATIGRATDTVEIRRGATAKVTLQLSLATGELEIIVSWESGGVILEFDLNEPAMAEYDIARVHYTLTHGASGEIKEGDVVPEDDIAYVEVPELWSGTWQVEIELWEPDGLEPIALTDTTLDVDPGTMTELSLEYTQLYPLEIEILRPAGPIQLYGWPDLRPAYLNGPYTAAAGEEIGGAVSVDIVNDGIGVAPASAADGTITVGFYLSPTPYRGPLSVSIGATDVASPIEADSGDSVPVPANLSIPEETPDGDYSLIAAVDADRARGRELGLDRWLGVARCGRRVFDGAASEHRCRIGCILLG